MRAHAERLLGTKTKQSTYYTFKTNVQEHFKEETSASIKLYMCISYSTI